MWKFIKEFLSPVSADLAEAPKPASMEEKAVQSKVVKKESSKKKASVKKTGKKK